MELPSPDTEASPTCAFGLLASAVSAVAGRRDVVERCQIWRLGSCGPDCLAITSNPAKDMA